MHHAIRPLAVAALCLLGAQGCSRPTPSAASGPATDTTPAAAPELSAQAIQAKIDAQNKAHPKACDIVTAQEMSTILGTPVSGELHEGSVDKSECIYKPDNAVSPYVEFTVEWGEGESAMAAAGVMGKIAPGIADPYAGIGDKAIAVGTGLMIKTGDDLVTIMFSGVTDAPAKARKIFDTAKPRI
ncbi:hypothetical protein [Cognatiluteimonas profundi]|uniref:hypothetical protein n=1 Tax=Cognatiluteimonas profundi TaxID=2594501 RepID=UPI00131DEEC9|nr:hypothetical protein [Lysobacter profundi]